MSTHLILSTSLMVVVLAATYFGIARLGDRQRGGDSGLPARRSESVAGRVSRRKDDPAGLGAAFVVIVLALGALTLAAVGAIPGGLPSAFALVVGFLGLLLTGFLFLGTYVVVREHGLGTAQGVAAGLFGVGSLGILLVAANLVFKFI